MTPELPAPLLATRLFPPPLPAGYIPRPRLLEALSSGLEAPLIMVSASAGFGKSTLVADWLRA